MSIQGFSMVGAAKPWTKVLIGRYVLGEGGGASAPKFFRLMTGSDAEDVIAGQAVGLKEVEEGAWLVSL